ncbi:MAG TPA: hypothetical protein VG943_11055 [Caulobacterales bacterium]|nr:hypothetical protein [Caulobacterales bacterium]
MARRPFADADRALFWTLAIAAFAAAAVGLAARAVDRAAAHYESERRNYAIVRVIAPEGPDGIVLATAALVHAPHVAAATPMSAQRAAQLLRQWGGNPIEAADMPPLRLIELELEPSPPQTDVTGDITAALARDGVTGEVVRAPETAGAGAMAGRARAAALWGSGAFAIVMALIISLAARGLAQRRRELMHVLADMGATQRQAARRVADEAAVKGFSAGLVGAACAALIALGLIFLLAPNASFASVKQLVEPLDVLPLALTPFAAAVAAAMGARAGAESFYAQAARLA